MKNSFLKFILSLVENEPFGTENLSPKFFVTNLPPKCHWNIVTKIFVSESHISVDVTELSSNIQVTNKFLWHRIDAFFCVKNRWYQNFATKILVSFFLWNFTEYFGDKQICHWINTIFRYKKLTLPKFY